MSYSPVHIDHTLTDIIPISDDIPYEEILNSMGAYIYKVTSMRLEAGTMQQIVQPIVFIYKDANGEQKTKVYTPELKSNAFIPVCRLPVDMLFDGINSLRLNILANDYCNVFFDGFAFENKDYLELKKKGIL